MHKSVPLNDRRQRTGQDFLSSVTGNCAALLQETDDDDHGIPGDLFEELEDVCGVNNHTEDNLIMDASIFQVFPESCSLATVTEYQKDVSRRSREASYRKMVEFAWSGFRSEPSDLVYHTHDENDVSLESPGQDAMIQVRVYRAPRMLASAHTPPFLTDIICLGSNTLADLRDTIFCYSDFCAPGDFSETPHISPNDIVFYKELYPSSYFFIDGVFYDDMRDPKATRLSTPTMEFLASKPPRHIAKYTLKQDNAETSKIGDIPLRLGVPYYYKHQGTCDHILMFLDVFLPEKDMCQRLSCYPLMYHCKRGSRKTCRCCMRRPIKWAISGSRLCPEDPTFLCHECHISLHYDINGMKICDFQATLYRVSFVPSNTIRKETADRLMKQFFMESNFSSIMLQTDANMGSLPEAESYGLVTQADGSTVVVPLTHGVATSSHALSGFDLNELAGIPAHEVTISSVTEVEELVQFSAHQLEEANQAVKKVAKAKGLGKRFSRAQLLQTLLPPSPAVSSPTATSSPGTSTIHNPTMSKSEASPGATNSVTGLAATKSVTDSAAQKSSFVSPAPTELVGSPPANKSTVASKSQAKSPRSSKSNVTSPINSPVASKATRRSPGRARENSPPQVVEEETSPGRKRTRSGCDTEAAN